MMKQNPTNVVYNQIKDKIDQGDYSPAQSLHEVQMATEFGVSRNTIKKALLMLENDGYVTIEENKGAKVRSYSRQEVLEYLELREVLEGFILRLAIAHMTDEHISRMRAIMEEMRRCMAASDPIGYSALNREFHNVIYTVCPNRTTVEFITRLKRQMKKYNAKTVLIPGRCANSFEEHRAILDAIEKHDPAQAEACMCAHLRNVRGVFEAYYAFLFS